MSDDVKTVFCCHGNPANKVVSCEDCDTIAVSAICMAYHIASGICEKKSDKCTKCKRKILRVGKYFFNQDKLCHDDCDEVYCNHCQEFWVGSFETHECMVTTLNKAPNYPSLIGAVDTEGTYDTGEVNVISFVHHMRRLYLEPGTVMKTFCDTNDFDYKAQPSCSDPNIPPKPYVDEELPDRLKIPPWEQVIPDVEELGFKRINLSDRKHLVEYIDYRTLVQGNNPEPSAKLQTLLDAMADARKKMPKCYPHFYKNSDIDEPTRRLLVTEAKHHRNPQFSETDVQFIHPATTETFSFEPDDIIPGIEVTTMEEQTPAVQTESLPSSAPMSPSSSVASPHLSEPIAGPSTRVNNTSLAALLSTVANDAAINDGHIKSVLSAISENEAHREDKTYRQHLRHRKKSKKLRRSEFIDDQAAVEADDEDDTDDTADTDADTYDSDSAADVEFEDSGGDECRDYELSATLERENVGESGEDNEVPVGGTTDDADDANSEPGLNPTQLASQQTVGELGEGADDDDADPEPFGAKWFFDPDKVKNKVKKPEMLKHPIYKFPTESESGEARDQHLNDVDRKKHEVLAIRQTVSQLSQLCDTDIHRTIQNGWNVTHINAAGQCIRYREDESTGNTKERSQLDNLEKAKMLLKKALKELQLLENQVETPLSIVSFPGQDTNEVLQKHFPHEEMAFYRRTPPPEQYRPYAVPSGLDPETQSQDSGIASQPQTGCPLSIVECGDAEMKQVDPGRRGKAMDDFLLYLLREEFRGITILAMFGSGYDYLHIREGLMKMGVSAKFVCKGERIISLKIPYLDISFIGMNTFCTL